MTKPVLANDERFRVYYYDAPPYEKSVTNPIDGTSVNLSNTPHAEASRRLLQRLELENGFAVRKGVLNNSGWKLGNAALKNLGVTQRPITAQDFVPVLSQKGVDMRIGLDIAWLALKRLVDVLVLVTGDSDFIPAMKLARREGLLVYLETMGHPVIREVKVHADIVL